MTGRSRELRAWAKRVRRQVELLRDELDLDSETKSLDAVGAAARNGLTFSQKALLVLATVSGLADAPAAIGSSLTAVTGAVEIVAELVGHNSEEDSGSGAVIDSGEDPREAEDALHDWLHLADRLPSRHVGEYQRGQSKLIPGGDHGDRDLADVP